MIVVGFVGYLKLALPNVGEPEQLTIEKTEERIQRGKYLANHVSVCMDCHSTRYWTKFSSPLVEGTLGKGGEQFDQKFAFPGAFYSKNITPFGLKDWTDGEILRAVSSGVAKDGKALFPVMPHPNYGKMDKEDLFSIIAYLRTLEPIENAIPASVPDFPMNLIINTIPQKTTFSTKPNPENSVEYGAYVFNAAACAECHTKQDKGKAIEGMELAGGFEFPLPFGGIVRSANITSDVETGIGKWSEEEFVNRFKAYSDSLGISTVKKGELNSVMPWAMYSEMTEQDLKAQKAIKNEVVHFTPQ